MSRLFRSNSLDCFHSLVESTIVHRPHLPPIMCRSHRDRICLGALIALLILPSGSLASTAADNQIGSLDQMVSLWLGVVFIIAHMGFYMYVYWDYKVEIYKSTGFAAQAAERARDHAIQAKNNKPAAPPANTAERVSSKKDMIKAAHAALKTGFVRQSTLEQLALEKNTEAMAADKKVNISAGSVIAMVSKRERRQMTSRQRIAFVFVLLPACLILVITTIMSAAVSSSASGPASVIVLLDIAASVVAFIVFFTQNEFVEASSAELKANKFMQRHPPKSFSIDPGTLRFWKQRGPAAWHFDTTRFVPGVVFLGYEGVPSEPVTSPHDLLDIATKSYGLLTFQQQYRRSLGSNDGFETTVLSNFPFPAPQPERYFEITVLDAGLDMVDRDTVRTSKIQIGLTCTPYPSYQMPGTHAFSIAWGNDGCVCVNSHRRLRYAPPWYIGDTIGVFHQRDTGRVSFTLNGQLLPECGALPVNLDLYPAIGVNGDCQLRINFGIRPFMCPDFNHEVHGMARSLYAEPGTVPTPKLPDFFGQKKPMIPSSDEVEPLTKPAESSSSESEESEDEPLAPQSKPAAPVKDASTSANKPQIAPVLVTAAAKSATQPAVRAKNDPVPTLPLPGTPSNRKKVESSESSSESGSESGSEESDSDESNDGAATKRQIDIEIKSSARSTASVQVAPVPASPAPPVGPAPTNATPRKMVIKKKT